jgi:uncharacterized protein YndB with AHSA1/START domain
MDPFTFHTTRPLPCPPAAVYAAFAAPEVLATWWGPDGFSNTFEVFEFQPGGRWQFVMHGPGGSHYPNQSRFEALEPGERIVIRHVNAPLFTLTVRLAAVDGGCRLDWTQVFDDAQVAQAVRHIVEPANEQNLDRLTRALALSAPA